MAIFSRRTLQKLIIENSQFISHKELKKHIAELNNMNKSLSVAVEWEILILNILSKLGKVHYEKSFGGTTKADIYFEDFHDSDKNFLADITSVSDKGLEEQNPFVHLQDRFNEIINNHGLCLNKFYIKVGSEENPLYKGGPYRRAKLKIPGRARLDQQVFNGEFYGFIKRIQDNPDIKHKFQVPHPDIDINFSYDPNSMFQGGSHPTYTNVYSLDGNTVYDALCRKRSQLVASQFKGNLGIFLCNGGSVFLPG